MSVLSLRPRSFPTTLLLSFFVLALALAFDVFTSALALQSSRTIEGNPFASLLLTNGLSGLIAVKLLGLLVAFCLSLIVLATRSRLYLRLFVASLLLISLLYFFISLSNLSALRLGHTLLPFASL